MLDNKNDEELMALISNGDHQAFSALVTRHTQKFFALAYRLVRRKDVAEDIVQDCFLKVWTKRETWDASRGAKFTTWFYRIVNNRALDVLRKKSPVLNEAAVNLHEDKATRQDQEMWENEEQKMIEDAINTLPERQREALNLCFYDEVSNKDAADIMGVGVKALESLLMRAKKNLSQKLVKENGEIREVCYG